MQAGSEEDKMFQQIVADLQRGKKTMDSLSPDESELFSRRAREKDAGESSEKILPEFQDGGGVLPELASPALFAKFLEENLADFVKGMDARTKFMVMILGRELKSRRPAARLQAARLLGELLGVFKRRKDGGVSPDSGTSGDGDVEDIEAFLNRKDNDKPEKKS